MQNKLEAEPDYQVMVKSQQYDAIKLYQLVKQISNGSTVVVVDDVMGKLIEAMFNFLYI